MAAKSIVEIDVNDERFQQFQERFNAYRESLAELPEEWRIAGDLIGGADKNTEKLAKSTDAVATAFADGMTHIKALTASVTQLDDRVAKIGKNQSLFRTETEKGKKLISDAAGSAKKMAEHIKDATASLLSWGSILGLFSGLVGAGGLFGINRLAMTASSQRFTAQGLGTTSGGLDAGMINYSKALNNPSATMANIRDAQTDLSKRWAFSAMGINNPMQDPALLMGQMIKNARNTFISSGSTLQGAQAHGLTQFFSIDELTRFKNMSDAEIDAMTKRAQQDTKQLQLSDRVLSQWQDFNIQLSRSGQNIQNAFIRGLAPLTPALTKLSDAVGDAIDTFLKSPYLGEWIDKLSHGVTEFANYLASPAFKTDVDDFISAIERMGKFVGKTIDWLSGKGPSPAKDAVNGSSIMTGSDNDPHLFGWEKSLKDYFLPIAERFNNPVNLRSAAGYPTRDTTNGKFAVFPNAAEGFRAAARQLQRYGSGATTGKPVTNIHDIISTWAPSSDNNKTSEYIKSVSSATHYSENQQLNLNDPQVLAKLLSAMSKVENSRSNFTPEQVLRVINDTGGSAVVQTAQVGAGN